MLTKDQIKYITKNIQPNEACYVFNASNIMNNAANVECTGKDCNPVDFPESVLLLNQLIAISNKLLDCHSCVRTNSYRNYVLDLLWSLRDYIQEYMKTLKLLYGFDSNLVSSNFQLPLNNEPIEIVNVLKELLNNYINKHQTDTDSDLNKVIINEMNDFLRRVIKSVYELRMANLDAKMAQGVQPVPDIPNYNNMTNSSIISNPTDFILPEK